MKKLKNGVMRVPDDSDYLNSAVQAEQGREWRRVRRVNRTR